MTGVTIDLQAAQSPGYRDRGVARYAMDFTTSVARRHPDLVRQITLNPALPPLGGADRLLGSVPMTTAPDFPRGGILHILSPFELDVPLEQIWPRAAVRAEARLLVTVYDLIPELFPDIYLLDPGQRRRYRARRELVRAADHILTLSRSAADDVVEHLGVPASKVTVVGAATAAVFGPPRDRHRAQQEAARAVPSVRDPFVIYNGAVEPRKNMEGLLEAFALLPPAVRANWQLVLVCRLDEPARAFYLSRAKELGLDERVVVTGFLPDGTLALLYQAADLAVCPSLYEGYGLPVAEATACGAPAIASATSSLVELVAPGATFDPRQPESIAAAMQSALTDPDQRERLLAWSQRRVATWDDVADRAAEVYRAQLSIPATGRWRRRRRMALVTPWPPAGTGVANYNERLAQALTEHVDVDVFVDGDVAPDSGAHPANLPSRDRAIGGYDAVVLALGNSEFHAGALRLLRTWDRPAVVHAHDVRLTNLYLHGAARDAVPEGFAGAVTAQYPDLPTDLFVDGRLPDTVADGQGVYMLRDIARRADRLFLTSDFAAHLALLDISPADGKKVAVWPFAYPRTVERDARQVDPALICSFGLVNPSKAPELLIDAVGQLSARRPGVRLALVGPIATELADQLRDRGDAAGLAEALVITGRVDDGTYQQWLAQAGLAVQLRRRTNGEMSAAVADSLVHAIPTVVTDLGPQAELGESATLVPADIDALGLAAVLEMLLTDSGRASDLGRRGQALAAARSFDWAARIFIDLLPELSPLSR